MPPPKCCSWAGTSRGRCHPANICPYHAAGWETFSAWRDRQSDADPGVTVAGSDVAIQMYTSGTTGHPKGAQLTHDNFIALLPTAASEWGTWSERDTNLVAMPLFHIAGSGWGLVGLYAGARDVVLRDVEPAEILRSSRRSVTHTLFVPAVLLFMLQTPGANETDFSCLDLIVYGASPIPRTCCEARSPRSGATSRRCTGSPRRRAPSSTCRRRTTTRRQRTHALLRPARWHRDECASSIPLWRTTCQPVRWARSWLPDRPRT